MKTLKGIVFVAAMIILPLSMYAQPGSRNMNYNTNTVQTLKGQITDIKKIPGGGNSYGIHFTLKTGNETIDVHAGPDWFMAKQSLQLHVNDMVEVKGSRITYNNQPAIIAAEINKDGTILKLRNGQGFPMWSRRNS